MSVFEKLAPVVGFELRASAAQGAGLTVNGAEFIVGELDEAIVQIDVTVLGAGAQLSVALQTRASAAGPWHTVINYNPRNAVGSAPIQTVTAGLGPRIRLRSITNAAGAVTWSAQLTGKAKS